MLVFYDSNYNPLASFTDNILSLNTTISLSVPVPKDRITLPKLIDYDSIYRRKNYYRNILPCEGVWLTWDLYGQYKENGFPKDMPFLITGEKRLDYALQLVAKCVLNEHWVVILSNSYSEEEIRSTLFSQITAMDRLQNFLQMDMNGLSAQDLTTMLLEKQIVVKKVDIVAKGIERYEILSECLKEFQQKRGGNLIDKPGTILLIDQHSPDLYDFGKKYEESCGIISGKAFSNSSKASRSILPLIKNYISTILVDDKIPSKSFSTDSILINIDNESVTLGEYNNCYYYSRYTYYADPKTKLIKELEKKGDCGTNARPEHLCDKILKFADAESIDPQVPKLKDYYIIKFEMFKAAMKILTDYESREVYSAYWYCSNACFLSIGNKTNNQDQSPTGQKTIKMKDVNIYTSGFFGCLAKNQKDNGRSVQDLTDLSKSKINSAIETIRFKKLLARKIFSAKGKSMLYELTPQISQLSSPDDINHLDFKLDCLTKYYGFNKGDKNNPFNGGFSFELSEYARHLYLLILAQSTWQSCCKQKGFMIDLPDHKISKMLGINERMLLIRKELCDIKLISHIDKAPKSSHADRFILLSPRKTKPSADRSWFGNKDDKTKKRKIVPNKKAKSLKKKNKIVSK